MNRIEAARILHPDTTRAALAPYAYDPSRKVKVVEEACLVAASCLTNPAYNDERRTAVAQALLPLATRVQPDACEGCGHDRSCATRGCNIILTAVELLGGDVSKLDTGSQATDLLEQSTGVDDGQGD